MVQIENEFGSFGDDKNYLHHLVQLARRYLGNNIILYTVLSAHTFSYASQCSFVFICVFEKTFAVMSILYGFRSSDIAIIGVIGYGMIDRGLC